ncbi:MULTISPECIES: type II toxin-antitoxin system Phd/YefM family antitoxin [unclassified Paenarthrobacter]|uniref:type II toxin-antitoxin system Phd/YefM family antitoxin n=1 Tax=unclassified Paenarthrobacter TaxID=2634190 RepID=UPI003CF69545
MTTTATFTQLLREPKEVLSHIDEGDIVVTRRGKEDLIVSKASDHRNDRHGLQLASALIAASLGEGDFVQRLHVPFPWLTFLTRAEQDEFAGEVVEVARGCAAVGFFGRLGVVISSWEATAAAAAEGIPVGSADLNYLDQPVILEGP